MASHLLRIRNASQLVLVCSGREKALKGTATQNLAILELPDDNQEVGVGTGLSIPVDKKGRIAAIGTDHEVDSRMESCSFERCIDGDERDTRSGRRTYTSRLGGGQGTRVCNEGKELIDLLIWNIPLNDG